MRRLNSVLQQQLPEESFLMLERVVSGKLAGPSGSSLTSLGGGIVRSYSHGTWLVGKVGTGTGQVGRA